MSAYDYQARVETARLNAARAVTRALTANASRWSPEMSAQASDAFALLYRCALELRATGDMSSRVEDTNAWDFANDCIAAWVAVDAWRRAALEEHFAKEVK